MGAFGIITTPNAPSTASATVTAWSTLPPLITVYVASAAPIRMATIPLAYRFMKSMCLLCLVVACGPRDAVNLVVHRPAPVGL